MSLGVDKKLWGLFFVKLFSKFLVASLENILITIWSTEKETRQSQLFHSLWAIG